MRMVYTADLHGNIAAYRALLDLAAAASARAAIVGGDLLPHAIKLDSAISAQRDFIERQLRPLLAEFHAAHPQIGVYLLAGNDDWAAAIALLDELEDDGLAYPLHERVYDMAGSSSAEREGRGDPLWLAGYACVPPTPFSIKDYERRDDGPSPAFSFGMAYTSGDGAVQPASAAEMAALPSIAEGLAALGRRSDPASTIYVCHTPPADTPLDEMPRGRHIGSHALRSFIELHAPLLSLHGHVHEAPQLSGRYATRIGATWCVNPGHDQRRFHAVTFDTANLAETLDHTVYGRAGQW
jgi:Icc-related predicted phosphoesterase